MEHSFNVELAVEYGVPCSIILKHMFFWIEKNRANETHYHEGRYWTYNSVRAFTELFPYLSKDQIARILKKLEDEDLIMTSNFNALGYDRTKWYSLTDKGFSYFENREMHLAKSRNGISENAKPIPDIKPYINNICSDKSKREMLLEEKDDKGFTVEDRFNYLRNKYPKVRRGSKAKALKTYVDYLTSGHTYCGVKRKFTENQIGNAVFRYIRTQEERGTQPEYYKNFETLMNQIADFMEDE